jgi:hypothetical protein
MQSSIKRIQTLADQFVNHNGSWIVDKRVVGDIRGRVRSARRFVLDTAGSIRFGEIVRDIPDLIIREQKFARAPYHRTFIELDFRSFWETVNNKKATEGSDKRIGYFIDHDSAYNISDEGHLMPFVYNLHDTWEVQDQLDFCSIVGTSRIGLDQFFWGSSYNVLSSDERIALRARHSVRTLPTLGQYVLKEKEILSTLVNECFADLRNIIGLLLLINRPSITTYVRDVPHKRGFVKGKLLPFMSYTEATIKIDPKPMLRTIGTSLGEAEKKRRHEVRGSWCHDEAYRKGNMSNCIHNFIPHPNYVANDSKFHFNETNEVERDNWLCNKCSGHRWWRVEHIRGNAVVGFVGKDYKATV